MIHQISGRPGGATLKRRYSRPARDKQAPDAQVRRATTASAIGNATEWFDYGIYAVATCSRTCQLYGYSTSFCGTQEGKASIPKSKRPKLQC